MLRVACAGGKRLMTPLTPRQLRLAHLQHPQVHTLKGLCGQRLLDMPGSQLTDSVGTGTDEHNASVAGERVYIQFCRREREKEYLTNADSIKVAKISP
jgi:hypothetical protein